MLSAISSAVFGSSANEQKPTRANHEEDPRLTKIRQKFKTLDRDGDGSLDFEEMLQLLEKLTGGSMRRDQLEKLFHQIDLNKDGRIDVDEFMKYMFKGGQTREDMASREARRSIVNKEEIQAERFLHARNDLSGIPDRHDRDEYWGRSVVGVRDARGTDGFVHPKGRRR
eukprot:TRINITY_DN79536_c0_g1_i1.p1 TRINITY_DN79536_c0_g1~~TRINITY_DN79536_c0_g1_i1.p1  ORF type:complete len:190 (+),score=31.88 TRINITY_DN79536_c0_g1_i1:64-570(+)